MTMLVAVVVLTLVGQALVLWLVTSAVIWFVRRRIAVRSRPLANARHLVSHPLKGAVAAAVTIQLFAPPLQGVHTTAYDYTRICYRSLDSHVIVFPGKNV